MTKFVFVPGAWIGGWVWKKIKPELLRRGHEVYTVTLTGMGERVHLARKEYGMETAIQDVINVIEYEDLDDVVLVGHSFAGKVISAVYDRIPERIRMLFYLDAFTPSKTREPQGGVETMEQDEASALKQESEKSGEGWRLLIPEGWKEELTFDLEGADREWFLSKLTPWPLSLAYGAVTLSEKVDKARKAYVFCARDVEKFKAENAGELSALDGNIRYIIAAHYPMITRPEETIDALVELSR